MINEFVNQDFIKLLPNKTVKEALSEMIKRKKSVAVVVDNDDNLKGIVVKADIYRFLSQPGHYDTYPVDLAMTKAVITANVNDDIKSIAKKLRDNDISAVPILNDGKVMGIVGLEEIVDYYVNNY